jgi:hypothetical protein
LAASVIEPLWVEFAALIGSAERPELSPTPPWGCHRRRLVEWAQAGYAQRLPRSALGARSTDGVVGSHGEPNGASRIAARIAGTT